MLKLFGIPEFENQEKQRRANILVVTQFASVILILAIIVVSVILTPEHSEVMLQGSVGAGAMLLSYFLLKKGYVEASGWVLAILGWLILTLDLTLLSGIRGVNVLGQVLIVMFAGLAISGRSAIIITLLSVGADFIALQLETYGILAHPTPLEANFARWFIQTVYTILAAVYIWRSDTVIKRSIMKSQATADQYRALFERTNDGVVIFDLDWRVLAANNRTVDLLGYPLKELTGTLLSSWDGLVDPSQLDGYKKAVKNDVDIPNFEHTLHKKDGSELPVEICLTLVPDGEGNPQHIQCILRDITHQKEYEEHLQHQATHDSLTNLPNRKYFENRYQLAQSNQINDQSMVAVLFIDIDNFKEINDRYGHGVGDQVLREFADRLQGSVREGDTVARIGGDEFNIILENINNKAIVRRLAEKFVECISHPFDVEGQSILITMSMGINIIEKNRLSEVDLIKTSDEAMYQVKADGKNNFRFYETDTKS